MKASQTFRMVLLGSVLIFFFALTNSNAQSFVFEMPVNPDEAYLIQKYDVYNLTAEGYHTGIDLYTKGGKPTIYPTAPGVVVIIQPNGPCSDYHGEGGGCEDHGLGNTVIIEHIVENGQPIYSLYAHLDSINPSLHEGSVVGHSDPVGIMGASGYGLSDYWKNSDGTPAIHLHFEIKDEAVLSNPKGEGIHFGYVPSSADNYGYHNPYTFLDRVEDIIVTDPIITSPLKISPSPPYYVGDKISAEFTVTNKGLMPIIFNVLTLGGRDPDNQVADFPFRYDIILNPNQSYNYKGILALTKAGKYHFFCAYQTPDGEWNTSIDLGPGLTNKDRVENITVETKEKPPEYGEEGWSIRMEACEFLPERKKLRLTFSIENQQDKSAEYVIERAPGFLDDIGNTYEAPTISPAGRRVVAPNASEKVYITSPELDEAAKNVVLYLNFIGHWPEREAYRGHTLYLGPIDLEKVPMVGEEPKGVSLPESFVTEDESWKVTLESYRLLEGSKLEFTFLIENLQEKASKCKISGRNTYLGDNLAIVYRDPHVSIEGYKELTPHTIERVHVTFSGLSKKAEAVILNLFFEPLEGYIGDWTIGPIILEK